MTAENEAKDIETVSVPWRDLTFTIPADRDEWPFEAGMALEEGKYMVAVRELLPPDQFADFLRRRPSQRDGTDVITAMAEALGMRSAGESPASSD